MKNMLARNTRKTTIVLWLSAVGMFGFGFALVPLYDVLCAALGISQQNISEKADYETVTAGADVTRSLKVQFLANNDGTMSWEFKPNDFQIRVHPGEPNSTTFYARNPAHRTMIAQAIPSISPPEAAKYFHKTECFCFNQQQLDSGESIDMPLQFIVDKALPKDIHTITLSYTLFDVTGKVDGDTVVTADGSKALISG